MATRNAHWYDRNEGLAYPVDESASAADDAGLRLPSNILADLSLRWPVDLGRYAFLSSVTVTRLLVTVTVQAADGPDGGTFRPLAVLSVPRPAARGRMLALSGQATGVGGWVVFGSGVEDAPYSGRFSSPRQSLLAPRAARPYNPLPVRSLSALGAAAGLGGVVLLKAEPPLVLAREEREIEGVLRECVVVRLVDAAGADGFPVPARGLQILGESQASVFRQFAGPCAGRPESSTCGVPEPIEFVNAVPPDCDGVLTLEFRGHAHLAQIVSDGVVVDTDLGLADACIPPEIPNSAGALPDEYDPANVSVPAPWPVGPPPPPLSESSMAVAGLPYVDCFEGGVAQDFGVEGGLWGPGEGDSPVPCPVGGDPVIPQSQSLSAPAVWGSYATLTASARNVSLWNGPDVQALYRRVTTHLRLNAGPVGARHNAAVVLNYRPGGEAAGQWVYYLVEVDYDSQEFRVSRFNGVSLQTVVPVTVPGILLGKWYEIDASVVQPRPGVVQIGARLRSVSDPGLTDVALTVDVSNYQPSVGRFGLGSNRSLANFAFFRVSEAH